VILVDRRGRKYTIPLSKEKSFHTHVGTILHNQIIGLESGSRIQSSTNHQLLVFSPTLEDFVTEMPHATQVIYPKDLGIILAYGDIFPGAKVVEAGLGSGALTLSLLRAVGDKGKVISYEIKEEIIEKAVTSLKAMNQDISNIEVKIQDVYEGIDEDNVDRIVLDLPSPWLVVPHAEKALVNGGILVSFLPTIFQVHELHESLKNTKSFEMMESFEVLLRPWSIGNRSVRPQHRMVAHTGFITTARKCEPRPNKED